MYTNQASLYLMPNQKLPPKLISIDKLECWQDNYRRGDIEAIARSIKRFGFNGVLRVRDGIVFAGNHTLLALRSLRVAGEAPPADNPRADHGGWFSATTSAT